MELSSKLLDNQVFSLLKTLAFSFGHSWQPFCYVENKRASSYAIVRFLERNHQPMFSALLKARPPRHERH